MGTVGEIKKRCFDKQRFRFAGWPLWAALVYFPG